MSETYLTITVTTERNTVERKTVELSCSNPDAEQANQMFLAFREALSDYEAAQRALAAFKERGVRA